MNSTHLNNNHVLYGYFHWRAKESFYYAHFAVFYILQALKPQKALRMYQCIISCAPCSDLYYLRCFSNERNN